MKKKKILVTGAGGFIGSNLVEKLIKKNFNVTALVQYSVDNNYGWLDKIDFKKNKPKIITGDICDGIFVDKICKNIDYIIHLAALISIPYSYRSPLSYIHTNILGTTNLLDSCRKNKIKHFIHTSTSEVYGSAKYVPIDENHPLNAQSPYAASKIAADQICLSFHKSFNLPVTIIRPFNTFGPRQSLRAVIPTILYQTNKKNSVQLGNINSKRDFTFVDDTVDAFILAINKKKTIGEVINLGTGHEFSIKDVLNATSKILNKRINVITTKERFRPKKSEVNRLLSNNRKAKKILGWKPKFVGKKGFLEAIKLTLKWVKTQNKGKEDLFND
jgi:NAD dependent epimerase/dehydratase